jgi:hypothetical protein
VFFCPSCVVFNGINVLGFIFETVFGQRSLHPHSMGVTLCRLFNDKHSTYSETTKHSETMIKRFVINKHGTPMLPRPLAIEAGVSAEATHAKDSHITTILFEK